LFDKYNIYFKEKQMRDLLNLLDNILNESRGLSGREPGAVYKRGETQDDQIVFQNLTFYPKVGQYATKEETEAAFDQVQQQVKHPIEKINQASNSNRAFGIATFDTAVGTRYLAKFATEIKPVFDSNKFFQTTDIPGNFKQADARGSKEKAGYKPSDVLTNLKKQTPKSILAQIGQKFTTQSAEYRAAATIMDSSTFPVSVDGTGMDFTGFRDYFCEMLQPCVLINGGQVKGNAGEAAAVFMGRNGFTGCTVSFNANVSGGLYDSLLVSPDGRQIKLSSKGATGAKASSVNLLIALRELEEAGMPEFAQNYPEVVDILHTIDRGDHNSGPLNLAVQFDIITPDEISQVMSLKQSAGNPKFNINKTNLSDNLKQLYHDRTAENPSKIVPLNHLVSSIAYKVCNEINLKTNFSEAASDILNHSAFVQMYTDATKRKDGQIIVKGFRTIWPGTLFSQVTLEAQKSYSSTASSGGKLVFGINEKPQAIPNVEQAATTDAPGPSQAGELVDYIPPESSVTARAGGVEKDEKLGTEEELGRKRQR